MRANLSVFGEEFFSAVDGFSKAWCCREVALLKKRNDARTGTAQSIVRDNCHLHAAHVRTNRRGGNLQPMVRSPVAELPGSKSKVMNLCERGAESCDSSGEMSSQSRTDGHF
jgi:hypothetical protein